jgi:hypothetical protein
VVKGFISYTHTDYDLCKKFGDHLALSKDHGGADFWVDNRISPGEHWTTEIAQAIDAAEIFLLLVSAKFFGSAYINDVEWPHIQGRAARCDRLVVPIILRRCSWKFKLGGYQAVPTVAGRVKPICDWRPHNNGYDAAHEQVLAAIRARTLRLTGRSP